MTDPRESRPLVVGGQGRSSAELETSARVAAVAIFALALLALLGGAL
ncbi:MAG: hypothetical protein HUU06_01320 [Planctomycetaceae bacterium]|nr:hypothetical protein [Planctomycetota bacterium]NUN51413.1 hypothetical protein [Planctomycetaceae bacterium]